MLTAAAHNQTPVPTALPHAAPTPSTCRVLFNCQVQLLQKWLISRQIVKPLVPINLLFLASTLLMNIILVHGLEVT